MSSDFYQKVYEIVNKIPKGRVTTYGAIAEKLGTKKSSRMVGYAMNNSHAIAQIPAHRVVNRVGLLTGKHYFPTPTYMQEQLEKEGITIQDDKIIDFQNFFWQP